MVPSKAIIYEGKTCFIVTNEECRSFCNACTLSLLKGERNGLKTKKTKKNENRY